MRNRILYLIIIGGCLLSSCNLNRKSSNALPVELIQAENIMYENPDSALQLLQGMAVPADKEAHATWALLLTQAKYKCNVKQSDSLVNIAYNYFKINGSAKRKVLALYIKGGIENGLDTCWVNYNDKITSEIIPKYEIISLNELKNIL